MSNMATMTDSQHLHSDWSKPLAVVDSFLRFTGISIFDGHWSRYYLKIKYFFLILNLIGMIQISRFLAEAISDGANVIDLATDISYLLISLESCLLYLHFFYSLKKIKSFVSRLGEEWCDDGSLSPDLIALGRKELKSFTRFNYLFLAGIALAICAYMIIPASIIIVKELIFKEDIHYTLPFRLIVPFNYEDNFLLYIILYGFLIVNSANIAYLINGGMLLLSSCIRQLRVLFDLIQPEIRNIFNSKDNSGMEDKIKRAIEKHSRLLKLIRELSDAFGAIFALHLFLLSAVICFFGITAMINRNLNDMKNLMASVISTGTIYYCCYQGQLLTDSTIDVGTATYDSEWYSLSREHKKIVLMIILRSQQITYIQSTGFTHISLTSFVKIMNMAWSFISLINGMYEN